MSFLILMIFTQPHADTLPASRRGEFDASVFKSAADGEAEQTSPASVIREAAAAAGLPASSSPHGLRKAACRRLADAGCDPFQIQAITGHKNLDEVLVYVRDRDQTSRASDAMDNYAKVYPQAE